MPVDISKLTQSDVARMMDLAILTPEWQDKHQLDGCREVEKYKFAAYYVLPHWTPLVVSEIGDFARAYRVLIGTGISFPYGSPPLPPNWQSPRSDQDWLYGAGYVANIAWLKDRQYNRYQQECREFVNLCHARSDCQSHHSGGVSE